MNQYSTTANFQYSTTANFKVSISKLNFNSFCHYNKLYSCMPINVYYKTSSKKGFKIRFGGRRGKEGRTGCRNKGCSMQVQKNFKKIEWYVLLDSLREVDNLSVCLGFFQCLLNVSLLLWKSYYFRTFSVCLLEKHFRNKSCANVRVSVKQSLLKLRQLISGCVIFHVWVKPLKEYG